MDFFKSVFSNDPEPSNPQTPQNPIPNHIPIPEQEDNQEFPDESPTNPNPNNTQIPKPSPNAWNFDSLIKTLTSKSEQVLQTYRRDLEEFSSGLKNETAVIRRAVKDLPGSLEVGASVAQESLESVRHAIDELGSSIWHEGNAILANSNQDDVGYVQNSGFGSLNLNSSSSSMRNSGRFEAMVYNLQVDSNTYCQEPDDLDDYSNWVSGFVLEEKEEEIEGIFEENGAVEGIFSKVVPRVLDYETFWGRYFYRVYKLKQAEDVRANLVKRAIEREEEEEDLSWEVDDEEIECGEAKNWGNDGKKNEEEMGEVIESDDRVNGEEMDGDKKNVMQVQERDVVEVDSEKKSEIREKGQERDVVEVDSEKKSEICEKGQERDVEEVDSEKKSEIREKGQERDVEEVDIEKKSEIHEKGGNNFDGENSACDVVEKGNADRGVVAISGGSAGCSDEKTILEGRNDTGESSKDSDFSVISSQPSHEEDDLGWDEIEDLGSIDEKRVTNGNPVKVEDLRKRLSAADDDEDLSWDIEDDDPVKP